jgi:hypothetical protein
MMQQQYHQQGSKRTKFSIGVVSGLGSDDFHSNHRKDLPSYVHYLISYHLTNLLAYTFHQLVKQHHCCQ